MPDEFRSSQIHSDLFSSDISEFRNARFIQICSVLTFLTLLNSEMSDLFRYVPDLNSYNQGSRRLIGPWHVSKHSSIYLKLSYTIVNG